jgi:hypothetical protein
VRNNVFALFISGCGCGYIGPLEGVHLRHYVHPLKGCLQTGSWTGLGRGGGGALLIGEMDGLLAGGILLLVAKTVHSSISDMIIRADTLITMNQN